MGFTAPEQQPDLPAIEARVLQRWRERRVFERSLEQTASGPVFRLYEGPPTANGLPGVHHVEARVFKDLFARYRTMLGEHVPRPAGWDCHGIPVELEVERELGIGSKREVEEYGVGRFNDACRESVHRSVAEFERLSERIGYWLDTAGAYWTMAPEYVESVWWSLQQLHEAGLLYEDDRVVPYCPRCGTALSDHEVAQGYAETDDPSIFVRFPVLTGPLAGKADLLVWTTMPWTLVPATLAVVGPDIEYVVADGGRAGDRPVVVAADRLEPALGPGARVVREASLDELVGARYQAPFDFVGPGSSDDPAGDPATWRFVVADEFVRTDEGTGIVHTGAAYGEDDMRVARAHGLPVVRPVDAEGRFDGRVGPYAGLYVRDADQPIIDDLAAAGLLLHASVERHVFPFCWRCSTPLLYCAKPSWYISTTRVRDRMIDENAAIDWRPDHIREGRFGDWLANNVDWALSRERYWGTPLPFWRCVGCQDVLAVGSIAELGELAGLDLADLDPHRPDVDEIVLDCGRCGAAMQRVPEVIDAWYDSGAMPFAMFGYPHRPGSQERFSAHFPADLVCEAIDQTRGWFYSLLAISTLLFDRSSYRRALCLGHIVDDAGRKMSKSAGNVLDPWGLIDAHGADPLRWLLLVDGTPWQSRRVSEETVRDASRRVLHTLWNVHYFFATYAALAGWTPEDPPDARHPMDRWVLAELNDTVATVRRCLDDFDATRAGRRIADLVDDLSNWYVRRSRDRLSPRNPDPGDRHAAFATLHRCLVDLAGLLAPFTPFLADELHESLVRAPGVGARDSVHLAPYPTPRPEWDDPELRAAMSAARRLVSLGRDARNACGIPVRQPLGTATVTVPTRETPGLDELLPIVAGELNVKQIERRAAADQPVNRVLRPNFAALGPAFGKRTPQVVAALERVEADAAARQLDETGSVEVDLDGETVELSATQLDIVEEAAEGWQVSSDAGYLVGLDTAVDEPLRQEGLARELARLVNDERRKLGLDLGARISLQVEVLADPDGAVAGMLDAHAEAIAADAWVDDLEYRLDSEQTAGDAVALGSGQLIITLTPAEGEQQ